MNNFMDEEPLNFTARYDFFPISNVEQDIFNNFLLPNDQDTHLILTDITVLFDFTLKHEVSKLHRLFPIFCSLFYEAHIELHISIHL